MFIDLSGYGPEWFDLIFCPYCKDVVTSVQDLKDDQKEIECSCGKTFSYEFNPNIPMPRVKIRPAPKSILNIVVRETGEFSISGRDQKKVYLYCFMEWENFEDVKGRNLVLTIKVKEAIYDQAAQKIPAFILSKSRQFELAKEESEKNLQSG